jgi:molybdate transport system regulatory protein
MKQPRSSRSTATLRPRLRVTRRKDIALGPGKAELLALIGKTGSIVSAAQAMEMSYMRAWSLVKTMNRCFKDPLVMASRGGGGGGGAKLTAAGKQVLTLYQQMEVASLAATASGWKSLRKLLRD